jgi:hypothetical protein
MSHDGKALEKLLTDIEKLLLGEGYSITSNERVYDDDGNQIAEFDVSIEGRVGSTSFNWLIECRNRPSKGPAPSSWIQHLSGRRQLFDFDKVIAVSATGFSIPAQIAARKLNVSLREVKSVQEISSQLGTIDFRLSMFDITFRGLVDFVFRKSLFRSVMDRKKWLTEPINPDDFMLRYRDEYEFLTLKQFILRDHKHNETIKKTDNDEIQELTYNNNKDLELLIAGRILSVESLSVPITLTHSVHPIKVLTVNSYGEDETIIGEEVAFSGETPDAYFKSSVLIVRQIDDIYVVQNSKDEIIPK